MATDSPAELADQIIKLGLSVREAEGLAREAAAPRKAKPKAEKDADTKALEKLVSGGSLQISYKTLDQLEDICRRLQC